MATVLCKDIFWLLILVCRVWSIWHIVADHPAPCNYSGGLVRPLRCGCWTEAGQPFSTDFSAQWMCRRWFSRSCDVVLLASWNGDVQLGQRRMSWCPKWRNSSTFASCSPVREGSRKLISWCSICSNVDAKHESKNTSRRTGNMQSPPIIRYTCC